MEKFLSNLKEIQLSKNAKIGAVAAVSGLVLACLWRRRRNRFPSPWARGPAEILEPNYEKDKVYLFQYAPSPHIVSVSPFCLKLESFLRLKNVPYESRYTLSKWSKYGQLPFIELNGEHLADSVIIINELSKRLNFPGDNLTAEERGHLHAASVMIENNTFWSYIYYRYSEGIEDMMKEFTFLPKIFYYLVKWNLSSQVKLKAEKHGIGRHSKEEIYALGCQDLQALSDMLGDKPFFAGKQMTTADCTIFAHLAQIVYIPIPDYPHLDYMKNHCSNLVDYVERVKNTLWPDWDEKCHH